MSNGGAFNHENTAEVAEKLLELCEQLKQTLADPVLLRLTSPMYVMGDVHGNFEDLLYFMRNLVQVRTVWGGGVRTRCARGACAGVVPQAFQPFFIFVYFCLFLFY